MGRGITRTAATLDGVLYLSCCKCGHMLPETEFGVRSAARHKRHSRCHQCLKDQQNERYIKLADRDEEAAQKAHVLLVRRAKLVRQWAELAGIDEDYDWPEETAKGKEAE